MSNPVTKSELKEELSDLMLKIFRYFDKQFGGVNEHLDDLTYKFSNLQSTVDTYAKQVEIYQQESLARDAQVDRLQRWIEQIAQKTGVKLEY